MSDIVYFAVYDIIDNNTRESLIQILKDAGLVRIQKSVFCGKLNSQQKKDLLDKIKIIINEEDSLYLLMNCSACFDKMETFGKTFDEQCINNKSMVF